MKKYTFFLICFIFLATAGCRVVERTARTTTVVDSTKNIKDVYKTKTDSVFVYKFDSIFVQKRNDTVFIERFKDKYIYRFRTDTVARTDTIFQIKIQMDSISLERTQSAGVIKQKSSTWKFWLGLAIGIGSIILLIILKNLIKNKIFN